MAKVDTGSLSVCIQALQDAMKYYEFISQSETVNKDDHEECVFMYANELARLIDVYKKEEKLGNTDIPLAELLDSRNAVYLEL